MALTFDELLVNRIGEFGIYQRVLLFALSLVAVGTAINNLIHVFIGETPAFTCATWASLTLNNTLLFPLDNTSLPGYQLHLEDNTSFPGYQLHLGNTTSLPGYHLGNHVKGIPSAASFYANVDVVEYDANLDVNGSIIHDSIQEECSFWRNGSEISCTHWQYDRSQYSSTIVTEVSQVLVALLLLMSVISLS